MFLKQSPRLAHFLLLILSGCYLRRGSIWKLAVMNNSWLRPCAVIQLDVGLRSPCNVGRQFTLDAGCSTHRLSVPLSTVETGRKTQTFLVLAQCLPLAILFITCVSVPCALLVVTFEEAAFISLRASDCVATSWRKTLVPSVFPLIKLRVPSNNGSSVM